MGSWRSDRSGRSGRRRAAVKGGERAGDHAAWDPPGAGGPPGPGQPARLRVLPALARSGQAGANGVALRVYPALSYSAGDRYPSDEWRRIRLKKTSMYSKMLALASSLVA